MEKLDIARIKKYNAELRECTEKSANLRAQLNMAMNELNRLCETLTAELGVAVNPDNLETVYKQCVEQLENTLTNGEEILARIKSEEASAEATPEVAATSTEQAPQYGAPSYQAPGYMAQPAQPAQPAFPNAFMGQPQQAGQPMQSVQQSQGFTPLGEQPGMSFPGFGQPVSTFNIDGGDR